MILEPDKSKQYPFGMRMRYKLTGRVGFRPGPQFTPFDDTPTKTLHTLTAGAPNPSNPYSLHVSVRRQKRTFVSDGFC